MSLKAKEVPGFEDNYYLDPEQMRVINKRTGYALKPRKDGKGYAEVELWKDNKRTHKRLHRLFAEAYIPNPDNLPDVNHKDENPMNYNLDNLEWCTKSYNQNYGTVNARRGSKISTTTKGRPKPWVAEQKSIAVVSIDGWGNECSYPSTREAARQLGLDPSTVTKVLQGHRKTTGGYRFRYAD